MKKITTILAAVFLSMSVIGSEIFTKDFNGNYGLDKYYINKAMPVRSIFKFDYNPIHILTCKSVFKEEAIENKEFFKNQLTITTSNVTNNILEVSAVIDCTEKTLIPTYEMLKADAINKYELCNKNDYEEYHNISRSDLYEFHDTGFYFLKNKTEVIIRYSYLIEKGKTLNDVQLGEYKILIEIKKDER